MHRNGYINSQNYHLCCSENQHTFVESGLHPLKIGIRCGIPQKKNYWPDIFRNIHQCCTVPEHYSRFYSQFRGVESENLGSHSVHRCLNVTESLSEYDEVS